MDEPDVLAALSEWRDNHATSREIGVRATAPGFGPRRPDLANLYLQISRTNPPRPPIAAVMSGGPSGAILSQMKVPTMFVVGEDDDIIPPHVIEAASLHIPGSTVVRVPGAGHSVYFEQSDVFNFLLGRFITQTEARGA
jgi:pimeloyl-ACP methyl ester carboxylesterase